MTAQQKRDFWRTWAPLSVSMIGLVFAAAINLAVVSHWMGRLEQRVEQNTQAITAHITDDTVHMPFNKKIEVFPTRVEWDRENKLIRDDLSEIKSELKELNKKMDAYLSQIQ